MSQPLIPVRSKELDQPNRSLDRADHKALHNTVLRSVVGAGAGAFLADILCRLLDAPTATSKLFMVCVATGAFTGVALNGRKWISGFLGGTFGSLGSLASALASQWIPFSAGLLGLAAAPIFGDKESPKRKLLTGITAGILGYSGLYAAQVILQAGWLAPLVPEPVAAIGAGAMAGLFIGLATAPKYLLPEPNSVETAFERALQRRDGEVHELLSRALDVYRSVSAEVNLRRQVTSIEQLSSKVSDHVLRILYIAEHCRRVEDELSVEAVTQLEDRIAELQQRIDLSKDTAARDTYQYALSSLEEQLKATHRLQDSRERVIARLHVNVALLEKLRLNFLQLGTANAERYGVETSNVYDELEALGRELDATAQAIHEVFGPLTTTHQLPTKTS